LLAACASGDMGSAQPTPSRIIGKATPSSNDEQPLPTLDDSQTAAMLRQIAPEYRRWLFNPDGYIVRPANATIWPCEVLQAERERLAGIPQPTDGSGTTGGVRRPQAVEDPQVHVLKGQCANGKLRGELALLAEFTAVQELAGHETRIPHRILSRFTAQDGQAVGPVFKVTLQGTPQSTRPPAPGSPDIRTVAASFGLVDGAANPRGVTLHYVRTETPKPAQGTHVTLTQTLLVNTPLKGDRSRLTTYSGATKVAEACHEGGEQARRVACDAD
jgi:hypothetical protein